jgi:hypothetical protein
MPWLNRAIVRCLTVSVPAAALLGGCDQADAPTTPTDGVVPEFGEGTGTMPGKVTGGGQIIVENGTATFGFNARRVVEEGTEPVVRGHLNYVNHVTGVHLNCEVESGGLITPAGQEPGSASFGGYECTPNSTYSDFVFTVFDNGEPGRTDVFTIIYNHNAITDGDGSPLRSGNIQIHKNP